MSGKDVMEWVDNSTYAYQRWSTAIDQPDDVTKIFFSRPAEHSATNIKSFLPLKLQPAASLDRLCAAVLAQFSVSLEWVQVPCNQRTPHASFVCEIKLRSTKNSTVFKQHRFIDLAYIGCPARMLQLNSSCLRGFSVPSSSRKFMEDVCIQENLEMFQLPYYLDKMTKAEQYVVDLLISMTHRWSTKPGDGGELSDKIIVSPPSTEGNQSTSFSGGPAMVVVRFSEMVLTHVEVANLSETAALNPIYVMICSQPLAVVEVSCLPGHAPCNDKTCILSHYFCDGFADCPDYSDEKECSHVCSNVGVSVNVNCFKECKRSVCVCHDLYFQCPLGGCIPWSRVCDGIPDCGQAEDEDYCVTVIKGKLVGYDATPWINATSIQNTYSCIDGPNISVAYKNDLVPDCLQDDEQSYREFLKMGSKLNFFPDETLCQDPHETTCVKGFKGVCYPRYIYCIHDPDLQQLALSESLPNKRHTCRNGGHLVNCEMHSCPSHFKCPLAFCIPIHAICNGRADCPNGEDEEECKALSCPGMLLCRHDNVCVHPYDVRSGHTKCPISKDDQALADVVMCPVQCLCHGLAVLCEYISDLKIPALPLTFRLLKIRRSNILLDNVIWQGERSFILLLEVSRCNISSVKNTYFRQMQSLIELSLKHNSISYLRDKAFSTLIRLESLDLSYNNITQLQPGIFEGTKMLEVLKLQYNNLRSLAACTFGNLPNLKLLNMSNNLLTYFGDNILCSHVLDSIQQLDVSQNNFHSVDPTMYGIQSLVVLNTAPSQICCYVPMIPNCYPSKIFVTSSCKRLLGQKLGVSFFAAVGGFLVGILSASIAWFGRSIVKTSKNKRKSNITTSVLFVVDIFKGTHFVTLAVVDFVLRDRYGLYDDMWRSFGLCIFLNATAYASMLASSFASLLIAKMRMLAIVRPFNTSIITTIRFLVLVTAWGTVMLILGYMPYSGLADSLWSKSENGLCFGLILPTLQNDKLVWKLGAFVCPMALMLCIKSACQVTAAYSISHSRKQIETQKAPLPNRRPAVIRCLLSCVVSVCSNSPLLAAHIATAAGAQIPVPMLEAITIFALALDPVINAFLYIFASPSFVADLRCRTCSP